MNNVGLNFAVPVQRSRTKSQVKLRAASGTSGPDQNTALKRTLSDSDIRFSRRSLSQCSRSRTPIKKVVNIDDLLDSSKKMSSEHGPRPNPIGMASQGNGNTSDTSPVNFAVNSSNNSFSQSLDIEVELDSEVKLDSDAITEEKRLEKERKKEMAFIKLRSELDRAHQELRKRDEECKKLSRVRDDLDNEVEELTASLFEEANKMVLDAKTKQAAAEMLLKESNMKLDGLQAEVGALKILVITSTPSNPGKKGHRRAPSVGQICTECQTYHSEMDGACHDDTWAVVESLDEKEVDRIIYREFVSWLEKHCPLSGHSFLEHLETEEVLPCLRFPNQELGLEIHRAIVANTLAVEAVTGSLKSRRCALTKSSVSCAFRVRLCDNGNWYFISDGCRARIVAVANMYTFLRYINQGLIRKEVNAMYWELVRKKGQMALTRLGLSKG